MASIPHTTHTSHDKQLEKLRGQDWFPGARSCPEVNNPWVSLSALVVPAAGGAEEEAALAALPVRLFPQEELLGSRAAALPGGRAWPSPEVTGGAGPPAPGLPRVAPDVPPPPLAGAPWNSMTPGGAGRAAVPAPALPPPTAGPRVPPRARGPSELSGSPGGLRRCSRPAAGSSGWIQPREEHRRQHHGVLSAHCPQRNAGKAQRRKNYSSIIRFCTFVSSFSRALSGL